MLMLMHGPKNPPNQATATSVDVTSTDSPNTSSATHASLPSIEPVGGRLVAAWARDPTNGKTYQVIGNFAELL